MEPLTLEQVAASVRGRLVAGSPGRPVLRVVTDSRQAAQGDLFVCLEGPRFDGHDFAATALAQGCAGVLAHRPVVAEGAVILVRDTLEALAALARDLRRRRPDLLVVAITGSNGKTSTKDFTAAALGARLRTVSSPRSFNNSVGVPHTLLSLRPDTEAVVAEIGTNAPGEIATLAALVRPEIAIITNIGAAHLQGLGSLEGVRREKGSLLDLLEGRRVAVLNRDDPSFEALAARAPGPVVSFGLHEDADVRATGVSCATNGTRFVVDGRQEVRLRHLGRHAVGNALAALAAACAAGVPLADAALALAAVPSPPGRLQVRRLPGLTVIDDTYNANPGSLAAAMATLDELAFGGRRLVVMGDMLELGEASLRLHEEAGRRIGLSRPDLLLAVGLHAPAVAAGARSAGLDEGRILACPTTERGQALLSEQLRFGDVVLLKASRGMQLERLVSALVDTSAGVA